MGLQHAVRYVVHDLPNVSLLRPQYRRADVHVVTLQSDAGRWLCRTLTDRLRAHESRHAMHAGDSARSGQRGAARPLPRIPLIVQSDETPSPLVHAWPLRVWLRYPRYVLVVRDLRTALVTCYAKTQPPQRGSAPFGEFLHNRWLLADGHWPDLCDGIRFLNAWTRDIGRLPPGSSVVLRYEDLSTDPATGVQRVWGFLGLPPQDRAFFEGVAESRGDQRSHRGPQSLLLRSTRRPERHPFELFDADDREFFVTVVRRQLHDWFGYDYEDWTTPAAPAIRAA